MAVSVQYAHLLSCIVASGHRREGRAAHTSGSRGFCLLLFFASLHLTAISQFNSPLKNIDSHVDYPLCFNLTFRGTPRPPSLSTIRSIYWPPRRAANIGSSPSASKNKGVRHCVLLKQQRSGSCFWGRDGQPASSAGPPGSTPTAARGCAAAEAAGNLTSRALNPGGGPRGRQAPE